MPAEKQLCIGLSLAVTWLSGRGWRHPDSQVEDIHNPEFYVDLARRAEAAKLDFVFRPDSLFIDHQVLADSPGFSSVDPTMLMAALAQETQRIGLVTTASTTLNAPYTVARQIQSLNQISNGRAGWNVVTALDGQQNFGVERMPTAEVRYAIADEFTQVVQKLWDSFPCSAIQANRDTGQYADIEQIGPIDHQGDYFQVKGPLTLPGHPAGSVPLFQAGASDSGRNFAAKIADAIFAATPDRDVALELRQNIQHRAVAHGRPEDAVRVLPGLSLYLADSREEARALYQANLTPQALARKKFFVQEALGLDLDKLTPEQLITPDMISSAETPVRSRTHADLLRRLIQRETLSLEQLLQRPEAS